MKSPLTFLILLLTGCQPHLNRQPKVGNFVGSEFFADGAGARPIPTGTVPHPAASSATANPLTLRKGRALYEIHCSACHGLTGSGGLAGARGFLNIPSLNTPQARALPAERVAEIIEKGERRMYAMGNRIPPAEAAVIARYLHVLQRSQFFPTRELPAPDLARLEGAAK